MQMRYDLLIGYAALLGVSLSALIVPIPVPLHMILITTIVIYVGCHQAAQTTKETQSADLKQETMRRSDVYMFPIIGSCVLFSLYVVFKIFPRALMVALFKLYFMMGGIWVVAQRVSAITIGVCTEEQEQSVRAFQLSVPLKNINQTIRPLVSKINQARTAMMKLLEPVMPYLNQVPQYLSQAELMLIEKIDGKEAAQQQEAQNKANITESGSPLPSPTSQGTSTTASTNPDDWLPDLIVLDGVNAIAYGSSIIIATFYLLTNHWFFNNIFGIFFSIQAIELINLGSYVNGAILLCGLFFYDIFWVFGTEVMVTVAKGVDAPIKLLFPRGETPAMLGLGDIVIPGLFIALMLRYDIYLAKPFNHRDEKKDTVGPLNMIINKIGALSFITISTDYFNLVLLGYVIGLITTVGIMFIFQAAQPALLYLVPACLLFTAGIAAALGKDEFNSLVNYADHPATEAVPKTPVATSPAASPAPTPA